MKRFLLIDCNNFFVSCERLFNPKLRNKPVVVLSSNDGCIIARSNEAKALGIPMGAPLFQWQAVIKKHNVIVYSSNFALYGDISARVMKTIAQYATHLEIYSIDEAFLFIPEVTQSEALNNFYYTEYGLFLRKKILQHTGIPVSIGIGPTKTLAKIANKIVKKNSDYNGVFDITNKNTHDILHSLDVRDIWGIGSRYAKLLRSYGIHTARDFIQADGAWIKKKLTVVGHKTFLELRGISCLSLEEISDDKKSITVSRSFGRSVTSLIELKESVAHYISIAAQKLRAQKLVCSVVSVFIISKPYRDAQQYYNSISLEIPVPTSYTPDLITTAHACLERIYKPGYEYKKTGVILSNFVLSTCIQLDFSYPVLNSDKKERVIKSIDFINKKFGRHKIIFSSAGFKQLWRMKQLQKSACFTTNWHELLTIYLK